MNFTATGNLTFNESRIETLNLSGDEQFLTDLFNILSNQAGKDVQFEGSTYRPVNQLKDAIGRIKSGTYSMVPYPPVQTSGNIQVVPVTKEAMSADTAVPDLEHIQAHRDRILANFRKGDRIDDRTYTHTCHACGCTITNSSIATQHACPSCDNHMTCTKDAKL